MRFFTHCLCSILFLLSVNSEEDAIVTNLIQCETTKGDIKIEIYRDWAPLGADRFVELVRDGFFQDIALFRCVKRFLTQFGISDKPQYKHWHGKEIPDDPNLHKGIKKNYLSFAGGGPNTRSTQMFIAFEDLDFLGFEPWETPFGKVIEGQGALDNFYKGYGDIPPFGKGPDQQKIHNRGNQYIRDNFPLTDFILGCRVLEDEVSNQEEAIDPATDANENEGRDFVDVVHPRELEAPRIDKLIEVHLEKLVESEEHHEPGEATDLAEKIEEGEEEVISAEESVDLSVEEEEDRERKAEERQSPEAKQQLRARVEDPIKIDDSNLAVIFSAISVLVFVLVLMFCLYGQKKIIPSGKMA